MITEQNLCEEVQKTIDKYTDMSHMSQNIEAIQLAILNCIDNSFKDFESCGATPEDLKDLNLDVSNTVYMLMQMLSFSCRMVEIFTEDINVLKNGGCKSISEIMTNKNGTQPN